MIRRDGLILSTMNYGLEDKQGDKIMSEKIKYVDMTPTWEGAMRTYIYILESEDATERGKEIAKEELMRLARDVDKMNEENKSE
jgi:hypothetical protein